ncbi:MAG: ABC transporter substrate-binding protein [Deltaproteobacteria bacterium]|nr:ABC transporter substrate-binding protein [Deltaproteobacteria bacterium]
MVRARILALGALATWLLAFPCFAQVGPAGRYLQARHEEVSRLLKEGGGEGSKARREEVRRILSELLDYEELARRALAAHWEARDENERREFVELLRKLVERNYEANLERILDYEVRYIDEKESAEGKMVRTEARSRKERRQAPIEIVYAMRQEGNKWRVFDVITDGVSLLRNYRNQFHRIISEHGWGELIRRMRERLEREGGGS